ncbi:MAG: hypothetical protein QOH26_1150 [Actinomycetota bacterium]|jgi:hypothetical protein|nr:hypothetical protein [Actinomycetota bacterium]
MRTSKRFIFLAIAGLLAGAVSLPAQATHDEDDHSDNARMLVRKQIKIGEDTFAQGTDLAFQKDLIIAGSFQGTSFFKRLPKAPYIKQLGFHNCPSSQGDVSVWGHYVYVSVDSPSSNNFESVTCNNTDESLGKEGIRIIDISDLQQPRQVKFIETDCGSHTHVLLPHGDKMYMYINSYPLSPTAQGPTCNEASHRKFSIIEFPKNDPTKAKVIATPAVPQPSIGCHDTTVFPSRNIAVAACLENTNVLDISDPADPKVLSTIVNQDIQFHHSSSFTWDGKYIIISDEYGGAEGGGGCAADENSTVGAMWFYNITDPENPSLEGHYSLPRIPTADTPEEAVRLRCTTHLYNILPTKDKKRYVAVSSYYSGGMSAVDFSDPADPKELGYYVNTPEGENPDSWAAYWYNNRIYSNDFETAAGLRVFKIKGGFGKRKVLNFGPRMNPQVQIPGDLFNAYKG